jgi:vancomycin resistance protein VanW
MNLRHVIPAPLRLQFRLLKRNYQDYFNYNITAFAKEKAANIRFSHELTLSQPIMQSAFYENKIHNIQQGCQRLENVIIHPNQILSFWKCVKKPFKRNNFRIGRNLINGKLSEDYGGGLCQLSSILYHLSLMAGLEIIERHHHSFDIYQEHERFTPLGADATVVYAYKDLRIKNSFDFPICFTFRIEGNTLVCTLRSAEKIEIQEIVFTKKIQTHGVQIEAKKIITDEKMTIATSFYQKR